MQEPSFPLLAQPYARQHALQQPSTGLIMLARRPDISLNRQQSKEKTASAAAVGFLCCAGSQMNAACIAVAAPPSIISHNAGNTIAMQLALKPGCIREQRLQVPEAPGCD